MKARVTIFYRDGVFDPQGNTIAQSLQRLGFSKVESVRVGKVIDVELGETTSDRAQGDVHRMCEKLLVNPVIESYKIEIVS